jgi:hypothetical protein
MKAFIKLTIIGLALVGFAITSTGADRKKTPKRVVLGDSLSTKSPML